MDEIYHITSLENKQGLQFTQHINVIQILFELEGEVKSNRNSSWGASGGRSWQSRDSSIALGVAELAELGGDVPNREARMGVEDGIDVPGGLAGGNGDEGLVASLPPCSDVLSPLLVGPPQRIGTLLVQAMQRVAMHVMPHLRLVYVARPCLLRIPEHLVCHLHLHA